MEEGWVVGMASGLHYVHPDKAPQMFVNEVAVAPAFQRRGLGRRLVGALLEHGRGLGCGEAWVLTEASNAALAMYSGAGCVAVGEPVVMVEFGLDAA